jgi:hypothetical protein
LLPSRYLPLPPANKKIAWGKLIAALLRNSKFVETAGLIRSHAVKIAPELFKEGAFIFLIVAAINDAAQLILKIYIIKIPSLSSARDLFMPIFFFVADSPSSDNYADIFAEIEDYSDKWIKTIHYNQSQ